MLTTTPKIKLKDCTFTLHSKPSGGVPAHLRTLLWCNKVPKGKRNKPAKINGIQHSEISDAVVHSYYMPVQ